MVDLALRVFGRPFGWVGSSRLGSLLSGATFRVDIKRLYDTGPGQMNRAQLNGEFQPVLFGRNLRYLPSC
jgi:hypothetical protein